MKAICIRLKLGMKVLLELVPSRVSWGRHHRVGGTQAIIGNWRGSAGMQVILILISILLYTYTYTFIIYTYTYNYRKLEWLGCKLSEIGGEMKPEWGSLYILCTAAVCKRGFFPCLPIFKKKSHPKSKVQQKENIQPFPLSYH